MSVHKLHEFRPPFFLDLSVDHSFYERDAAKEKKLGTSLSSYARRTFNRHLLVNCGGQIIAPADFMFNEFFSLHHHKAIVALEESLDAIGHLSTNHFHFSGPEFSLTGLDAIFHVIQISLLPKRGVIEVPIHYESESGGRNHIGYIQIQGDQACLFMPAIRKENPRVITREVFTYSPAQSF